MTYPHLSTHPPSIQHYKIQSASPAFPQCATTNKKLSSNYTYKSPERWSGKLTVSARNAFGIVILTLLRFKPGS